MAGIPTRFPEFQLQILPFGYRIPCLHSRIPGCFPGIQIGITENERFCIPPFQFKIWKSNKWNSDDCVFWNEEMWK